VDKIVFTEDVVKITHLARETISRFIKEGKFPKPRTKIGGKNVWWRKDIDNWIDEQMQEGAKE